MGFLDKFVAPTDEVKFISQTLADYREVRKVYHYDYAPEDLQALQSCAKDLRPFTWSCMPAGVAWWLSGKMVATKGRPFPFRALVVVGRVMATGQVFRLGYLAGSYRQTTQCMKGLVSLPTPLGGEMVALIRARNPQHPYLKFEQRPRGFEYGEEPRPRIATEANRQAQIVKFQKELATARSGQAVRRGEGEALEGLFQKQTTLMGDVIQAREEYEEKRRQARAAQGSHGAATAATPQASGSSTTGGVASGPQGLVITDPAPAGWDAAAEGRGLAGAVAAAVGRSAEEGAGAEAGQGGEGGAGGGDIFDVLGAGGAWGEGEEGSSAEQAKKEQQARRERRRDRWGRLRSRDRVTDAQQKQATADPTVLEGGD